QADELLAANDQKDASAAHAYLRGLVAMRESRFNEAATHLAVAASRQPRIATVHYQLGKALQAAGEKDLAREQFSQAAQLDPIHGAAQYQLATLSRAAGDMEAYRNYYREFQRIRAVKGDLVTDASLLEACSLTEIELPPSEPTSPGVPAAFSAPVSLSPDACSDVAVLDIDQQGAYVYVAAAPEGRVACGRINKGVWATVGPLMELAGYAPGEPLRLLVGNAIVDPAQDGNGEDLNEVLVCSPSKCWLLRLDSSGAAEDLTAGAGLQQAKGANAMLVDYDHDGALDILTFGEGELAAYRNRGDRRFIEATAAAGLAGIKGCRQVLAQDFEGDNLGIDLLAIVDGQVVGLGNAFRGRFEPMSETPWGAAEQIACDDLDADASADVAVFQGKTARFFLSRMASPITIDTGLDQVDAAATIDYDNDGLLDLAVAGRSNDQPVLLLLQNRGRAFAITKLESPPSRVETLLDVDADGDGDTDLIAVSQDNSTSLITNVTHPVGRQLKLSLHSYTGQPSSIGVRVQARHGGSAVTRFTHRQLPIEIGLGTATEAQTVQTVWGNGVVHNELDVAATGKPVDIQIIEFIRTSSCPFLYARCDSDWRFETDVLGASPLNVAWQRGVPIPPDDDEVLKLSGILSEPSTARFTSELREATYLDEVVLLDIAHDEGVEVFSTDHTGPKPVKGMGYVAGRNRQPAQAAKCGDRDVTQELGAIDNQVVLAGQPLSPPAVGHTQPGSITFRIPPSAAATPRLLALTGWFRFGSSSTNIASADRQDVLVVWPRLEARVGDEWTLVDDAIGIPTGNTKTIVCRLPASLPADTTEFRLTTSLEVRWDAIALYEEVPNDDLVVTHRRPVGSEVSWHGFSRLSSTSPDRPQTPAIDNIRATPPWFSTIAGWCTRYGDATPLLMASDEKMVILNAGDGVTVTFEETRQPHGERSARTQLLYVRGWIKEWDPNAEPPQRVAPFPGSDKPAAESEEDWQLQYNTRWVPSSGGWST
ncbi:MAG: hypothetical protein KDA37_13245, partial [Planctomycetales bacterium]|nr:hypothetical protein [Planctomycetales bacterium]